MEQKILFYLDYSKSSRLIVTSKANIQQIFKDRTVAKITPYLASIINELQQQVVAYKKPVLFSRSQLNSNLIQESVDAELTPTDKMNRFNQQALHDYKKVLIEGLPAYNQKLNREKKSELIITTPQSKSFENSYIAKQAQRVSVSSEETFSYLNMKQVDFLQCCLGEGYCTSIDAETFQDTIAQIKAIASGNSDATFFELFASLREKMTVDNCEINQDLKVSKKIAA